MTAFVLALTLMMAGLVLLVIEVLVIPGFGVIGALGLAAVAGSGYVAVTELPAGYAALTIAAGVAGAAVVLWLFPRTRAAKAMVLETQTLGGAGNPALKAFLGREGVTLTPLRPSGSVEIDETTVDVVSDGQYVEPGTRVKVVLVEGSRVVVEPVG